MINPKVLVEASHIRIPSAVFPNQPAVNTAQAKANIDALVTLLQQEEVEITGRVGWLDEMTPAARVTMTAYLLALNSSIT